jgi:peptidyl-prolyl cis-trans isomerase C
VTQARLQKFIREPLVHFLVAGAALFLFMGQFATGDSNDRRITIDEAKVASLAGQWQQTWRRPPSPGELDSLIREYIKEEIYYREAIRLGLDAEDPVIRRRLRTKMEFLETAQVENIPPTEGELRRFYEARKVQYAQGPTYSFEQKYLGEDVGAAKAAVVALSAGERTFAAPLDVPATMNAAPSDQIARTFGEEFVQSLRGLPVGKWVGPVRSGFGWHAVRISQITATNIPPLEQIRQDVSNDWRAQTRSAREANAYKTLLEGYDIRMERP